MPMLPMERSQGLSRTLFSVFQSNGPNLFSNDRIRPGFLVNEMKTLLLYGCNGVLHAVSRYIPNGAPMNAAPELLDLESQHGDHQKATNTSRGPTTTPLHPLRNVNSHATPETDDLATASGYSAVHVESDSHHKSLILPRKTGIWKAMFVVGVLSVIVLPGLVVGVMTRQMSWGFELSGAIAPIVSLFAGLYYHKTK